MTTIEDWVATFTRASRPQLIDYMPSSFDRAGLLAVIEKHVGQMVAEAFSKGSEQGWAPRPDTAIPLRYAARILSALTATEKKT